MKWIGQNIYDLISRFRSDVYLEDISTGTIASGAHLGLDSNNKIVKAADGGGDLTSIVAGTGLSGTDLTGPIPTLNVDASQTQITSVGTIGAGVWQGTTIKTDYIGDDQVTEDKLANTLLAEIDANTAKVTNVTTNLTATTHASQITINSSDGTNVIVAEASGSIAGVMSVTHHDKLDAIEASATADQSKSDIDGLAITTVGTIDTGVWNGTAIATDQQKHLANFEFEGFSVGDGTNYMIPEINSDTKAPFEHQTSTGSDGLTATAVIRLLRTSGHVMPYAGTLKLWKGWATSSGTDQTVDIGIYKATLVNDDGDAVSPVVLKNTSFTSVGNAKALTFSETSFSVAFAAGDILISAIRNGTNAKKCEFTSMLVVEWD